MRGEEHAGVEHLAQAAAGQVLEDQIGLTVLFAPVVDLEDVRVVEGGRRPRLGPEALEEGGIAGQGRMEDLDGHPAVQGDVVGQIDVRGRTGPQGSDESVAAAEDTPDGVGDTRHDYSGSDYRSGEDNRWRVDDSQTLGGDVSGPGRVGLSGRLTICGDGNAAREEPVRAREGGADLVIARWKRPHRDHRPRQPKGHRRPNAMPSDPTSTAPPGIRADGVADPELAGAVGAQASSRPSEPVAKAVFPPA